MASMDKRQDPVKNWELDDKNRLLGEVENWLTSSWLYSDEYHIVRDLWKRTDFISTLELLTIGVCLEKLKPIISTKLLREIAADTKSNDTGNRRGSIFELIVGSMFSTKTHTVTYPRSDQPGYDIIVNVTDNKKLRLSCKALIPSIHEINFKNFSNNIYKNFLQYAKNKSFILIATLINKEESNNFNEEQFLKTLCECFNSWDGKEKIGWKIFGWFVGFNKIEYPSSKEKILLSPNYLSHIFLMTSSFLGNEQLRFDSKVKEGIDNLNKHCYNCSENIINSLIIKVPNSISIETAKSWLKSYTKNELNTNISGFFIYRSSIVNSENNSETYLNHELSFIENIHANVPYGSFLPEGFQFNMEVPIGKISQIEPRTELHIGESIIDATQTYNFIRGHYFIEKLYNKKNEIKFEMTRLPYISISLIINNNIGKNIKLDVITPPTEELILI